MYKIDSNGATSHNQFTEGDPIAGIPPTVVSGDWLNAVQAELINAISAFGITPSKTDSAQLLKALMKISPGYAIYCKYGLNASDGKTSWDTSLIQAIRIGNLLSFKGEVSYTSMVDFTYSFILLSQMVEIDEATTITIPIIENNDTIWGYFVNLSTNAVTSAGTLSIGNGVDRALSASIPSAGNYLLQLFINNAGGGAQGCAIGEWYNSHVKWVDFTSTYHAIEP